MIDLTADLTAWLGTPEVRALLKSIVTEAVRNELRAALEDELLDVARAAQMLGMSASALRKRSSVARCRASESGTASGTAAWIFQLPHVLVQVPEKEALQYRH